MSKNKKSRNNRVNIPGVNHAIKVPSSKFDPNTAPRGAAFNNEDAMKLANAAFDGIKQVLKVMGIQGWFCQFIIPIVEFRKDVTMPDGSKKDDFVMTGLGINPAQCSAPKEPACGVASQALTPMLWKTTFNAELTPTSTEALENPPEVPPNPAAN